MVSTSAHTVTTQTLLLAGPLIWHLLSRCGRARESNRNALLQRPCRPHSIETSRRKSVGILEIDKRLQNLSQRLGEGSIWFGDFRWVGMCCRSFSTTPQLVKESCKTATQPSGVTARCASRRISRSFDNRALISHRTELSAASPFIPLLSQMPVDCGTPSALKCRTASRRRGPAIGPSR